MKDEPMKRRKLFCSSFICLSFIVLTACQHPGQTAYQASEVGMSRAVEFGTVVSVREVKIIGSKSNANDDQVVPGGTGLLAGGAAGGVAGSQVGSGGGSIASAIGGAVVGGLAGSYIEQKLHDSTGYEYVLVMQDGQTKTITLEKIDGDEVFKPDDKVMLQHCETDYSRKCRSGEQFQRLIKVDKFPPRPQHDPKERRIRIIHEYDDQDEK